MIENDNNDTHTNRIHGPKMITLGEAKRLLRPLMLSINSTQYGEYRVAPLYEPERSLVAYYTDNLLDAYRTGVKMWEEKSKTC